ncbi:MAG: ABC transporter substrate-binding protein [Candidatus Dormibacteria bacterium]
MQERKSPWRSLVAVGIAASVLAACGGGQASPPRGQATPGATPSDQAIVGDASPGVTPSADATAGATPPAGGQSTGGSHTGTTGGSSSGTTSGGGATKAPVTTSSGFTYTPASLYSGADATQGISASTITLCMHAAISLGAAFNETAADVSTYWTYLNANGGVLGRKVNFTIEDDSYTAQGAQQAEANCEALKPLFMVGGIGFDQDPVVRALAEQNHQLYLYTMADDGSQGNGAPAKYNYSFTAAPTIEQVGTWMGQVAVKNRPGPYGAVYVKDANWIGGYNTFKSYLDGHGGASVDGNSYTMNAGGDASGFAQDIVSLQAAGVQTVYLWMNALGADGFIEQAAQAGYYPAYVTPDGFDLVTGTVGESIDDKSPSRYPALAGWITPAFDPNNQNVPYWGAEKEMIDAYNKYDGGHVPDDIDWQAWLGFKSLTDLLKVCGNNCDRNDIAGIFNSGWTDNTPPLCTANFTRNRNFGGEDMNLWKAHRVPYVSVDYPQNKQHTVWLQQVTCANKFN